MEENETVQDLSSVKVKDLIPVDKIRELIEATSNASENGVSNRLDSDFDNYINSDDENVQKTSEKHNKRTLKMFTKRKEQVNDNVSATRKYVTDYEREEWYYKRHKDTIDKYIKKDDKDKKKKGDNSVEVVIESDREEEPLRVGLFKMWSIVFYDMLIFILGCIVFSPVHLVRYVAELFFKMRKSLAITVGIIVGVVVLTVGLIFGISALFNFARSVS